MVVTVPELPLVIKNNLYMMILDSRSIRAESYDSNVMNHSFDRFKIVLKIIKQATKNVKNKTKTLKTKKHKTICLKKK